MNTKICTKCGKEFVGGLKGQDICDNCQRDIDSQ